MQPFNKITCTWSNLGVPWNYGGLVIVLKGNMWVSALEVFKKVREHWEKYFAQYFHDCT
jgi:hypothetical protein